MTHPGGTSVTLGILGDEGYLHQETQKQLEAVLGDHFLCRQTEPTDTSVDVLIVSAKNLLTQPIMEALLAGFPPTRIVAVIGDLPELQKVCLDELKILYVVANSTGNAGSAVVTQVRSALGHLGDPPLARSKIEETFGQLDTQKSETFRGLAFKSRLSRLVSCAPSNSGLDVSIIPGRNRPFPFFGGCPGSEDVTVLHATEAGLKGLDAKEHALFTQALVCQCIEERQTNASFTTKFVEVARSILGWEELYRPALLIFRRSVQTLEILLTGDLDLWLVNPKRLPPVGLTRSPGVALTGKKDSPSGKERRLKLTAGDHLILMPAGWFEAEETNPKERTKTLLEFADSGHLPDLLRLGAPVHSGAALVVEWKNGGGGGSS
ncbi:MAG: hypothetical protein ABFS37_05000 [Acidobacteriota bacterium]